MSDPLAVAKRILEHDQGTPKQAEVRQLGEWMQDNGEWYSQREIGRPGMSLVAALCDSWLVQNGDAPLVALAYLEAIEALQLALNGIPDPMHPGIPPKFVDKLVAAQVVLMDALGHDDPGDVEAARRRLKEVAA